MHRMPRSYKVLIGAALSRSVEYRAQILIRFVSFVFPLVMMTVWLNVVKQGGPVDGWDTTKFVSYYVGMAFINYLASTAFVVLDWEQDVRLGTLSFKLLKPMDPFHYLITAQIGAKVTLMLFFLPVFIILTIVTPFLYYPMSPLTLIELILSVICAFMLNMFIQCTFGMICFWTTQAIKVFLLWHGITQFLSGWIIPLSLYPETLRRIAYVLPFRSALGFPMEIFTGQLTQAQIVQGFAVSFAWIAVFFGTYRLLWRRGIKKYEAVGA